MTSKVNVLANISTFVCAEYCKSVRLEEELRACIPSRQRSRSVRFAGFLGQLYLSVGHLYSWFRTNSIEVRPFCVHAYGEPIFLIDRFRRIISVPSRIIHLYNIITLEVTVRGMQGRHRGSSFVVLPAQWKCVHLRIAVRVGNCTTIRRTFTSRGYSSYTKPSRVIAFVTATSAGLTSRCACVDSDGSIRRPLYSNALPAQIRPSPHPPPFFFLQLASCI